MLIQSPVKQFFSVTISYAPRTCFWLFSSNRVSSDYEICQNADLNLCGTE